MGGVFCKRVEQTIRPLYKNQTSSQQASDINSGATNTQSKPIAALIQEQFQNALQECGNSQKKCGNHSENPEIQLQEFGTQVRESNPEMQETISGLDVGIAETNPAFAPEHYQPLKTNRYGDAALTQLKGIVSFGVEIITRVHTWTLASKPQAQKTLFALTWSSVNKCTTLVTESDTIPNLVTINLMPEDNRSAGKRRLNEIDLSTRYMSQTATRY